MIGEVIGHPVLWDEAPESEARQRMLARGRPAGVAEGVPRARAGLVDHPEPVTTAVRDITGSPARPFRSWVAGHAAAFLPQPTR
ncbi:Rossmann-fold NAD(P)-binding domain-containing protein [Saccharothrix syringae]|uniref:Uncharacterized protein n=1 Tax=Saccharothrix syringae TaxID=103733 RepID=A0A5Q0H6U8_SACSY|nr:hypothetical protein [Saccharothrix syringae]QFZ21931.1 hypothetical protein EKG83_35040 [Saccharothrix syringae]